MRRTLLAFAFYTLCALIIGFASWHGHYPPFPLAAYSIGYLAVTLVFLAITRLGWNLRFEDPSLTPAQIACSAVLCSYTLIYAGPFRGVFMFAYVVGLMFGGTQLTTRQLARLALLPLGLFPLTAVLAEHYHPGTIDWHVEFIYWVSLCVILAFTAMLVGNLNRLHRRLKASNAELGAALAHSTNMAVHDDLTGLYNRRYLLDMLKREKSRADRADSAFCVCILDLDHFKQINDTYGHSEGDVVLRTFATVAAQYIRGADLLGRWGGEEFLLLLPRTWIGTAEICLQRIKDALEQVTFEALPPGARVTFSAGVAQYLPDESVDDLIERADRAMYAAKGAGRNCIVRAEAPVRVA